MFKSGKCNDAAHIRIQVLPTFIIQLLIHCKNNGFVNV